MRVCLSDAFVGSFSPSKISRQLCARSHVLPDVADVPPIGQYLLSLFVPTLVPFLLRIANRLASLTEITHSTVKHVQHGPVFLVRSSPHLRP